MGAVAASGVVELIALDHLFDDTVRHELRPSSYSEPTFEYLNISARPEIQEGRSLLESWYYHYPATGRADLRARFRSPRPEQHWGALLELYLHELLRQLGCQVHVHPQGENTRRPDFYVQPAAGGPFYAEATVATGESGEDAAGSARIAQIYDQLNRLAEPVNKNETASYQV